MTSEHEPGTYSAVSTKFTECGPERNKHDHLNGHRQQKNPVSPYPTKIYAFKAFRPRVVLYGTSHQTMANIMPTRIWQ